MSRNHPNFLANRPVPTLLATGLLLLVAGCGRTALTGEGRAVELTLSPTSATVALGRTAQFTAASDPVTAINWRVEPAGAGTIDADGLYVAPDAMPADGTTEAKVIASARAPFRGTAEATVTIVPVEPGVPVRIRKVEGDLQTGTVGRSLPLAFLVEVVDVLGQGVGGVEVTFESPMDESENEVATTDDSGFASGRPTAGGIAGRQEFRVLVDGVVPAAFGATLEPGPLAALVATHPAPAARPGTALPEPAVVAAQDEYGNAVPTPALATTAPEGGRVDDVGTLGDARRYRLTLAPLAGPQAFTFTDTLRDVSATLEATGLSGPAVALEVVSGEGQAVPANGESAPLVVRAVDAQGSPVFGSTVTWSGTAATVADAATTTAGDGTTSTTVVVDTRVGLARITATLDGTAIAATFDLRIVAGAAQQLVLVSGAGQSTTANTAFASSFTVRATDAFQNPVADVPVAFSVLQGGGSITPVTAGTDAAGLAQARMTAGSAGPQGYRAASTGLAGSPIDVTGTAVAPAGLVIARVSGNTQTGAAGTDLAQPLVVRVTRAGQPVAGQQVQFGVVLGDGSVRPATAVTAIDGQAQTIARLGNTPGPQRFAANAAGATGGPITFDATATAPLPALLRKVSGDAQEGRPGATLPEPLVVEALLASGLPAPGTLVTFATTGPGTVAPPTATTDANGRASTTATLGATAGLQTFTATIAGLPPVTFTLTARAATGSRTVRLVSGGDQSAEAGLALAQPIEVEVTDDLGAPLANVTVDFRPDAELARVDPARATTDATGRARTTATLGRPVGTQRFFVDVANADSSAATGSPLTVNATALAAPASRLVVADGDGQAARINTALPRPLVVRVTDRVGNPISGITVNIAPGANGGSLSPSTGTSGVDGTVAFNATLGPVVGPQTFTATSPSLAGASAVFTATGTNEVARVSLTPQGQEFEVGSNRRYQAVAIFTDGSTATITNDATWSSSAPNVLAVNDTPGAKGVATAAAPGTAAVRATYQGVTGETTARVVAATLRQVVILPAAPEMVRGSQRPFTATGTYSNDAVSDVTEAATWTSANPAVATVSNTAGTKGLVRATGVGTVVITAAVGSVSTTRTVVVTAAPLATLEVTPLNVVQPAGTTARFRATATSTDGVVEDVTAVATWSSSDTSKMTVQNAPAQPGLATLLAAGTPSVVATYQGVSAQRQVTITQATVVALFPQPDSIDLALRDIFQFRVIANYSDGSIGEASALATWSSSAPAVADVSNAPPNKGTVTAITTGTATITATLGGQSTTMRVRVTNATIDGLRVFAAGQGGPGGGGRPRCPAGTLLRLVAGAQYSNGEVYDISDQASWSSSNPAVAVVGQGAQSGGVVQCLTPGITEVTAAWRGEEDDVEVEVTSAALSSITVTPSSATLAAGDVRGFFADGLYTDGTRRDLTGLVAWTTTNAAVATASNAPGSRGLVTGVAPGATNVVATLDGITGTSAVTVSGARLLVVVVSPANPTPRVRERFFQFNATAVYDDGSTQDVTAVSAWASSNPTVATVSNDAGSIGTAVLNATGQTTIQASYGGKTGATNLDVRP